MLKGLIGKKIGMTQIFDEAGVALPVTSSARPCYDTQIRTPKRGTAQLGSVGPPKRLRAASLASAAHKIPAPFLGSFAPGADVSWQTN
jgi:large subunit ribosomal protein L3